MELITIATKKVEIRSLVPWTLYFHRLTGNGGDFILERREGFRDFIDFDELQEQIRHDNPMFIGKDRHGGCARIWIVDDEVRREMLGDESDNAVLLTEDTLKALLKINDRAKFADRLNELITSSWECRLIRHLLPSCGGDIAAAWKIDMIEAKIAKVR